MKQAVGLLCAVLVVSCSPSAPTPQPVVLNTAIPMNEVMAHVVDPAARQFWAGSGESYSAGQVIDLSPQTPEAWKRVEDGAATLVIAANSLKTSGYAREPTASWNRYVDEMAGIAMRGRAAAEAQDKNAVGEVSEELTPVCDGCHEQFGPKYLTP